MIMTILEQMKKENSTIIEKKLNDKYYLFVEGLTKYGEETDNIEEVENILMELHEYNSKYDSYITTLNCLVDSSTDLNELTIEFVKEHLRKKYELD